MFSGKARIAWLLMAAFCVVAASFAGEVDEAKLKSYANGDHRSEENKARNQFRHPVETLKFFGISPDMTVVEVYPGGGAWYTEVLAPYLKDEGKLILAAFDSSAHDYYKNANEKLAEKMKSHEAYASVEWREFRPPVKTGLAIPGSVDAILTFRNVHGWMRSGAAPMMFEEFYKTLKPGGVLGVVQHRLPADREQDPKAASGYVKEEYVIKLAEQAGFILVNKSEINANPKDTADHEGGVWALPPSSSAKENKEKYEAIGESDRMTLKFVKP